MLTKWEFKNKCSVLSQMPVYNLGFCPFTLSLFHMLSSLSFICSPHSLSYALLSLCVYVSLSPIALSPLNCFTFWILKAYQWQRRPLLYRRHFTRILSWYENFLLLFCRLSFSCFCLFVCFLKELLQNVILHVSVSD